MKKTKLYLKKSLSVFMALMMLMTAWVFVAPEKAEAATAGRYYIKYVVNVTDVSNSEKDYNLFVSYKTNNGKGSLVSNEVLFDRDSISMGNTNDYVLYEGYINGFPTELWQHMAFPLNTNYERQENFRMYIGSGPSNLTSESLLLRSGNNWTYKNGKQDNHMLVQSGFEPYQESVKLDMSSLIITNIANGSSTVVGSVYDQYGVAWYQAPTYTISSSSSSQVNVSGISAIASGDGAYVKVTDPSGVFKSEYGYSTSTGKVTLYLRATSGSASASIPVTITAPKFNLKFNNVAGTTVYTNDLYYKSAVDCASIASGLANSVTQIADNNKQHQTYIWDATKYVTSLTADTVVTEVSDKLVDHNYGDWTQNENDHTRTCSDCGYVHTQEHIKGTGYVTKEETCTEDGVKTYDCSVCGKKAIETDVINNITGHNFTGDPVENVTGQNGNHWKKCSRCDVYGWGTTENACENHNWDENADGVVNASDAVTKASTCKEAGTETYTCQVCSATWTKTLEPAPHTTIKTAAKDVSNHCGGDGNVAFWTCSVCGRVWKDEALEEEVTDLTDADSDGIPDVLEEKGPEHSFTGAYESVSGGKDGKHHRQCERFAQCKTYGPEESHNWGEPAVTDSTCTKEGKKVYTCTDCNQTYEVTLEKAEHKMTEIPAVEAECGKAGNNKYYSCSSCDKYYKDAEGTTETTVAAETIPALIHTWTAHHDYDTIKTHATCQAAAVYNNHCDYCETKLEGATHSYGEADTVNGHKFDGAIQQNADGKHSYKCTVAGCTEYGNATACTYEVTEDVASTCRTAGHTTYKCSKCGNGYSTTKALNPNNHAGEGTYIIADKKPTCATLGSTGIEKCSGCHAVLSNNLNDIPVDPANHENMKDYEAQAATCQKEGWKAYKYCDKCGTYEIAKETIAKKSHKFTTYASNGDGTHTATCETCKAADGEVATDTKDCAGGTANCVDLAVCATCGGTYGKVDADNHKNVRNIPKVDSTCQTEGTQAYKHCDACEKDLETPKVIQKKEHIYDSSWSKVDGKDEHTRSCITCKADVAEVATETQACSGGAANCLDLAKCAVCKAYYGTTDPTVHKTQASTLKDVVAATCQKEGFSGNYHYDCCDEIKTAGTATEKLAHTFDIEVEGTRKDATCIAKGEVTYKCSTCVESEGVTAATLKVELDKDPDNHASDEEITVGEKAATCTTDGYTGDVYHKCCYIDEEGADNKKALIKKGEKIKANGQHVLEAGVPEYMLDLDENGNAVIIEEKDDEGNVISKTLKVKAEAPDYKGKIGFRHDDDKWYHAQICDECGLVVYTACYTYEHTYNCVETDICEICAGLCSLTDSAKHKEALTVNEGTAATCIAEGSKDYYSCAHCEKDYLDAAGKTVIDITVDDDEDGIADVLEIAKTAHVMDWSNGVVVKEPTCGKNGTTKYSCKTEGCGETVELDDIPFDGVHEWSEERVVITEPTCYKNGYKAFICTVCESIKPNSYVSIPATGDHDFDKNKDGIVDRNDADITAGESCEKPGTLTYTCQNEGCTYTDTETDTEGVSAHQWGEWVTVGGDCSSGVVQERICSECSAKEKQTITTDTHNLTVKVKVEPTPEKDGYVIYECKNCGYVTEPEVIKYEGSETDEHLINEEEYTVVKAADCTHGEIRAYICLRCGDKVEKEVGAALEHVWLEQDEEIATCGRDGHSSYYRCVRCLAEYGEGKVIYPATGHVDGDNNGKCDSCNSAFYGEGEGSTKTCGCICHKEGWFMKLIYKIISFFWKLFKIGHTCDCGAVHY